MPDTHIGLGIVPVASSYAPVRMTTIKNRLTTSSVDENVEQPEPSYTAARNVKWYNHFGT